MVLVREHGSIVVATLSYPENYPLKFAKNGYKSIHPTKQATYVLATVMIHHHGPRSGGSTSWGANDVEILQELEKKFHLPTTSFVLTKMVKLVGFSFFDPHKKSG